MRNHCEHSCVGNTCMQRLQTHTQSRNRRADRFGESRERSRALHNVALMRRRFLRLHGHRNDRFVGRWHWDTRAISDLPRTKEIIHLLARGKTPTTAARQARQSKRAHRLTERRMRRFRITLPPRGSSQVFFGFVPHPCSRSCHPNCAHTTIPHSIHVMTAYYSLNLYLHADHEKGVSDRANGSRQQRVRQPARSSQINC